MSASLGPDAVAAFGRDAKVGLLATLDEGDLPHVSLITTIEAASPSRLSFGQFCEGASKRNVRRDPRVGFLVMGMDRRLWRGTARWTGATSEGPEFEAYNRKPLFRYNSYFGVHTVHFLDVVSVGPAESLPVARMVAGAMAARAAGLVARGEEPRALSAWARTLTDRLDSVKFLSFVDRDGFPRIVPGLPAASAGHGRLVIVPAVNRGELACIPDGAAVAVFAMSLKMESVLVRGRLSRRGPGMLLLDIDLVYNSMPPRQGQVWPAPPLVAIHET